MTETQSFALLPTTQKSASATRTLFRDTSLNEVPFTAPGLYATDDSSRIEPLIHLGLAALLLPTIAYAASVLVNMTANGTLEKAVRALVP